tara:strand:- start:1850 stop:3073 length:1224 start_codon:yes stop_codon:yes gene_type:complete
MKMGTFPKENLTGQYSNLPMDIVHFGSGCSDKIVEELDKSGIKNAVIITGNTLATKTDLVEKLEKTLGNRCAGVFSDTIQHVHRDSVINASAFAREKNADCIISFGGGTPNDTAKSVLICLAENITEKTQLDKYRIKFEYPDKVEIPSLTSDPLPMFAIPTTLSAGEFTFFVGMTDEERKVKDLYLDPRITAKAVFLDPDLTLATPERLWLGTGIRAVDHCVEALCSKTHQPFTDALSFRALNMLATYLRETKENPDDLSARGQCMVAAWMSVCGLANVTLGLSHGIGHQLGARCDVAHGETSAVMLPRVLEFNSSVNAEQQAIVADALGLDTRNKTTEESAILARDEIQKLIRDDLGLPWRLRDVGVNEEDFAGIAKDAMEDLIVASNPRTVNSEQEVIELLRKAW